MVILNCAVCSSKKSRFIKEQEVSGLLSNLEIKTLLSWIPLAGLPLLQLYNVNEIVNKLLLAGDKLKPEMQPRFTYSALYSNKQNIYDIFTKMN